MSYQAMAHGADTIMFFQMRQCKAECEKLHSAFISHVGTNDTRIYKECQALGKELHSLGSEDPGQSGYPQRQRSCSTGITGGRLK
jgi:beta-galactosidase